MNDRISVIYTKNELDSHDRLGRVQFVMKTRQDKALIDSTSAVYIENEIKLS